ncbi:PAS domain-containing hybrid sensor histidine kinase/response regulator [Pseudomonas sp. AN-1]|uniref:hybrid sensor histidine kinase/response regulator n=1 Tax=Pseudomonas sp. AN-1 TaxID=3096605 RepID=UPI002A6A9FD6|nr:PAS domain-containing hybrid sensor histidine kinase/response regulator [Pseudomonas sp. AN-1]WPP47801.1 PAS domain-containing hybrid sensor histidine kinase/response regulator [Pseudomonas sp. AN-1]
MSLSSGLIAAVALLYMAILFAIAFYGDRRQTNGVTRPRLRAWVYSLSLAVYCTSWTFFGAVGQATGQLWSFVPIYLGPLLLLLFMPQMLAKMILISKQENITSIADFIAARYGKSRSLAIIVALICLVGVLPYIALQLKGIVLGVNLLTGAAPNANGIGAQDTALIVSLVLALFTILFGTRNLDATEHHRGMVMAVAFESLVKLLAFLAVGVFVTWGLFGGVGDLLERAQAAPELEEYWRRPVDWTAMVVQTGVAMMAIICLPRQFHVTVVENIEPRDLNLARWVFPLYLVLAALFVVPIALAGQILLPAGVEPDSFVISLPLAEQHPSLALLAFIGGASAATGMVIVASVALSTMISNDMLLPWLLRRHSAERPFEEFRHWLLSVRRIAIIVLLLLAYVIYRLIGPNISLASIGQIAFAAVTQLGPAMFGALYWKQANSRGVFAGLAVGALLWCYTLLLPLVADGMGWSLDMFPGQRWLAGNPLGLPMDAVTQGTLLSLLSNFLVFVLVSLFSRTRVSEHWQASRFVGQEASVRPIPRLLLAVQVQDLLMLAARFVGEERARQSFIRFAYRQGKGFSPNQTASGEWIAHTERLLAGVLGASSARAVVKAAIEGREMQVEDVVRIVDEASEVLQFNRALLQGAIENISQGISVVDQSLRLVAWNRRYLELFEYPEGLISIGRPIADIIRYNAERGLCGKGDPDIHVAKRLYWMRQGTAHTSERTFPNGRVIELVGNPMPGGGFVMSFTDITAHRQAEDALKEANESLEQRVAERTQELSALNEQLSEAKARAEVANQSKTRFLAAVSHDLMQPLNAARLFSAALSHQEALPGEVRELVQHLDSSLRSAEDLIADLLDISRLESGRFTPERSAFALDTLYDALGVEFRALAQEQGIDLRIRASKQRIDSDPKLLRRVLQNFLTNAFRYAKGKVLLGVRRDGRHLRLEVWDHGPGIPADKLKVIFEEFKRLDSHQTRAEKGLGLGLAIADGFCQVLEHRIEVRSWVGKGSVFSVRVPLARGRAVPQARQAAPASAPQPMNGAQVWCIDNEDSILTGMRSLLTRWGCQVQTARSRAECEQLLGQDGPPELVLVDYHLDDGETGQALMGWLRAHLGQPVPGVVISADGRPELIAEVHAAGLDYLSKPVKPAALRALLSRHLKLH